MTLALKPYLAYKSSGVLWLGDIPQHWQLRPAFAAFGERAEKNVGLTEKQVLSLSYGRIIKKNDEQLHGLVPASFKTFQIVHPKDLILRLTDLQNDQRSLRVGLAHDRGIITSAYLCLRPQPGLLPDFAYYLLHAADVQKVFYGMGAGLRQSVGFPELRRMAVPIPPTAEQQQISNYLTATNSRIERLLRAKRRVLDLLHEQKQALIHRTVTRGLNPSAPLKPSHIPWLGDIPAHWQAWRIGHLARVGNGSTPARGNPDYWTGGTIQWLNSGAANQGVITSSADFVTEAALRACHLPLVPADSVLVAITGQGKTRGTAAWLRTRATINQHLAFAVPDKRIVSAEYLTLALTGAYQELRATSDGSGGTKGALTCADLKRFCIALPPRQEQDRLASRLSTELIGTEAAHKRTDREITLLREYRTRLIADVVTGKLDVRGVALPDIEPELEGDDPREPDDDPSAEGDEPVPEDAYAD